MYCVVFSLTSLPQPLSINHGAVRPSWRGQTRRQNLCLAVPDSQSSGAPHPSALRLLITSPHSQGELSRANLSRSALQPGQQDTEEMDEQQPVLCSHLVNYWCIFSCWEMLALQDCVWTKLEEVTGHKTRLERTFNQLLCLQEVQFVL